LNAGKSGVQLSRGVGRALYFAEGFVEDFGDVEKTNDIAVFVANGLRVKRAEGERSLG
jgi:hypothetical protein